MSMLSERGAADTLQVGQGLHKTMQDIQFAPAGEEENLEAALEMDGKLLQSEDCDLTSLL